MLPQVVIQPVRIERQDVGLKQQRLEAAEEQRGAANRHGAEGVAVIAVLEADEARARRLIAMAPVLIRHLERNLDGGAAVVGIEDAPAAPRHRAEQQAGQFDGIWMCHPGEQHVVDPLRRVRERSHQRRMTMPDQDRPPRRDGVDDLASVGQFEKFSARTDAWQRLIAAKKRRVGMPNGAPVFFLPWWSTRSARAVRRTARAEQVLHFAELTVLPIGTSLQGRGGPFLRRLQGDHRHAAMLPDRFFRERIGCAEQDDGDGHDAFGMQRRHALQRATDGSQARRSNQHARPIERSKQRQLQFIVIERRKRPSKGLDKQCLLVVPSLRNRAGDNARCRDRGAFKPCRQGWRNRRTKSTHRRMHNCRRHEPGDARRIGVAGLDGLPVFPLRGKGLQPEQREGRLAGVGVGAEDDEVVHIEGGKAEPSASASSSRSFCS